MLKMIEQIKEAAYNDELQKIALVLTKYPALTGAGIGALIGGGINAKETYNKKINPKTKSDRNITNKDVGESALKGMLGGGLSGMYVGSLFSRNKVNYSGTGFKYRNTNNSWYNKSNFEQSNTVGKQFNESLNKVRTKSDATKIFREHAIKHHPDKGGKVEDMAGINNAWEDFKKHRFDKLAFLKSIQEKSFKQELEKIAGVVQYDQYGQPIKQNNNVRNVALGAAAVGAGVLGARYRAPIKSTFKSFVGFVKGPAAKSVNAGIFAGKSNITNPVFRAKQQVAMNSAASSMRTVPGGYSTITDPVLRDKQQAAMNIAAKSL